MHHNITSVLKPHQPECSFSTNAHAGVRAGVGEMKASAGPIPAPG